MKKGLIAFSLILLTASCSDKTAGTVAENAAEALPTAELTQGKAIFEKKCHRCHKLKVIDNYSAEAWNNILPDMSKKAHLAPENQALLKGYITWELAN